MAGGVPVPHFGVVDENLQRHFVHVVNFQHETEDAARIRVNVRWNVEVDGVGFGICNPTVCDDGVIGNSGHFGVYLLWIANLPIGGARWRTGLLMRGMPVCQ